MKGEQLVKGKRQDCCLDGVEDPAELEGRTWGGICIGWVSPCPKHFIYLFTAKFKVLCLRLVIGGGDR